MLSPLTDAADDGIRVRPTELQLCVVGDDLREAVATACGERDDYALETVPSLSAAQEAGSDADCLVVPAAAFGGDERTTEDADCHGGDGTVAADEPMIVVADGTGTGSDHRYERRLTAVLERDTLERLPARAWDLVERRRLAALSRRSLASVEFVGESIAIVTPDDEIQFASRSLAVRFGYDLETLSGTDWRALFPDATVDRLESTAIPTVADGWRWTGGCTAMRRDGETFPVQLRLGGLADGSLVFVVESGDDGPER
ncbi:PAS domain-containing protein [Natrinema thermotolerans]